MPNRNDVTIISHVDRETKQAFADACKSADRSQSYVLRKLVFEYIERIKASGV